MSGNNEMALRLITGAMDKVNRLEINKAAFREMPGILAAISDEQVKLLEEIVKTAERIIKINKRE